MKNRSTVIDAHLHLDSDRFKSAKDAADYLDSQRVEAGIDECVVLHLLAQPWSMEEFADALKPYPYLYGMVNLDPEDRLCLAKLEFAISELNYIGLKLHPRLQAFHLDEDFITELVRHAGTISVPVLIDAFPDGTYLENNFDPLAYARLARRCPDTKITIAHMGGHYVLDFMMLAKRIPNIYFDISYSFLYYRGSSIPQTMVYAMQSMRFKNIFYGSDYPDRPLKESLESSIALLNEHQVHGDDQAQILHLNAKEFFGFTA